jgi:hypothetical protein
VGLKATPAVNVLACPALTGGPPSIPNITPPPHPRVDDDNQAFPPLQEGVGQKAIRKANARALTLECNASVPRAPAQGNNGFILVHPQIQMTFASITTSTNVLNHDKASMTAKQAWETQKHNPSGRIKLGYSNAPMGFTDVVVIRNGGVEDQEVELAFRKRHPTDIAQVVQQELNCLMANPPIILRGKWSDTVQKTGNYIFRLAGNLSPEVIHSYGPTLCGIFPGEVTVIPTRGWTWIQLRGVDVEYMEEDVSYAYDEEDLLEAFQANLCFANAAIPVPLYWQGNPLNFKKPMSTVIVAILDENNEICQCASREGVCMFGRQVKFIRAGDHPSLIQCA